MSFTGPDGRPVGGRDISRYFMVEMREVGELRIEGRAPAAPHLLQASGSMQTGALLTMIDNVGGVCGGLASLPDGWVVTTNLVARTFATRAIGPMRINGAVLRRGRNNVVSSVEIHDEGNGAALVADGVLTSAILVPESGPPQWERPLVIPGGPPFDVAPPPISEWIGIRPVDAHAVEIDLAEQLRNPWGILHGGVVAALVDLAVEHATGAATADVVLHYLAPNRVGPVRAVVTPIGARADGETVRVEIRDIGAERVAAVAIATARA